MLSFYQISAYLDFLRNNWLDSFKRHLNAGDSGMGGIQCLQTWPRREEPGVWFWGCTAMSGSSSSQQKGG